MAAGKGNALASRGATRGGLVDEREKVRHAKQLSPIGRVLLENQFRDLLRYLKYTYAQCKYASGNEKCDFRKLKGVQTERRANGIGFTCTLIQQNATVFALANGYPNLIANSLLSRLYE